VKWAKIGFFVGTPASSFFTVKLTCENLKDHITVKTNRYFDGYVRLSPFTLL
jgi:hypothetical protein